MKTILPRHLMKRGVLLLAILCTIALGQASAAFKFIQEGMTPPEFKGKDLISGEEIVWKPGSGGEGSEVMLLVFWASWSPRSVELLGDLKDLSMQYGEHGFKVISVNVDSQEPSPMALKEITDRAVELDLPFPVVVDEGLKTFYAYGVIAVPSIALIDGEGHLRYGPSGYSYAIRDRIVDSTEVLLGLKDVGDLTVLARGYKPDPTASRYYRLGRRMASQSLYERALGNLDKAVEEDENFSSPHNLKGQIQLILGDWPRAEAEFAKAVELDSLLTPAWAGWGRALLKQDRVAEAAEKLSTALEQDETYTPALVDLADCRTQEGRLEEAWSLYQAARELNPRDPELLYNLGRFLREKGDTKEAVAAYRTAVEQLITLPILTSTDRE